MPQGVREMAQTHNCAGLGDGDRCHMSEYCQYKLVAANDPGSGEWFCGKDQLTGHCCQNPPRMYLDKEAVLKAVKDTFSNPEHIVGLLMRIERGEFDAKSPIISQWQLEQYNIAHEKAVAEKDAEIARLKEVIGKTVHCYTETQREMFNQRDRLKKEIERRDVIIQNRWKDFDALVKEIKDLKCESIQLKDRIAQQDKEIAQLKAELTPPFVGAKEFVAAVIRENKRLNSELFKRGQECDNYQEHARSLIDDFNRVNLKNHELINRNLELQATIDAQREANSCSNCGGTGVEHTIWTDGTYQGISTGTCRVCKGTGQNPAQKEPAKDEPELVICPMYDKSKCVCVHGEPHKHLKECDGHKDTTEGYCGASCIPYKEPAKAKDGSMDLPEGAKEIEKEIRRQVTDAVNSVPGACLEGEIRIEHIPSTKATQEPVPSDSGMAKDIGDLTLRMDLVDSRQAHDFRMITHLNKVLSIVGEFGSDRLYKIEERIGALEKKVK